MTHTMSGLEHKTDFQSDSGQGESHQDARSGGASEHVNHASLSLFMEQVGILHNPDAPEWDSGFMTLDNGQQMPLWSDYATAPTSNVGEDQAAFMARQRITRQKRAEILANLARHTEEACKVYRHFNWQTSRLTSESDRDTDRQKLIERLTTQIAESVNPRDTRMFEMMQQLEGDAARAAFDKVLAAGNTRGMDALTPEEKEVVFKYRDQNEQQARNHAP